MDQLHRSEPILIDHNNVDSLVPLESSKTNQMIESVKNRIKNSNSLLDHSAYSYNDYPKYLNKPNLTNNCDITRSHLMKEPLATEEKAVNIVNSDKKQINPYTFEIFRFNEIFPSFWNSLLLKYDPLNQHESFNKSLDNDKNEDFIYQQTFLNNGIDCNSNQVEYPIYENNISDNQSSLCKYQIILDKAAEIELPKKMDSQNTEFCNKDNLTNVLNIIPQNLELIQCTTLNSKAGLNTGYNIKDKENFEANMNQRQGVFNNQISKPNSELGFGSQKFLKSIPITKPTENGRILGSENNKTHNYCLNIRNEERDKNPIKKRSPNDTLGSDQSTKNNYKITNDTIGLTRTPSPNKIDKMPDIRPQYISNEFDKDVKNASGLISSYNKVSNESMKDSSLMQSLTEQPDLSKATCQKEEDKITQGDKYYSLRLDKLDDTLKAIDELLGRSRQIKCIIKPNMSMTDHSLENVKKNSRSSSIGINQQDVNSSKCSVYNYAPINYLIAGKNQIMVNETESNMNINQEADMNKLLTKVDEIMKKNNQDNSPNKNADVMTFQILKEDEYIMAQSRIESMEDIDILDGNPMNIQNDEIYTSANGSQILKDELEDNKNNAIIPDPINTNMIDGLLILDDALTPEKSNFRKKKFDYSIIEEKTEEEESCKKLIDELKDDQSNEKSIEDRLQEKKNIANIVDFCADEMKKADNISQMIGDNDRLEQGLACNQDQLENPDPNLIVAIHEKNNIASESNENKSDLNQQESDKNLDLKNIDTKVLSNKESNVNALENIFEPNDNNIVDNQVNEVKDMQESNPITIQQEIHKDLSIDIIKDINLKVESQKEPSVQSTLNISQLNGDNNINNQLNITESIQQPNSIQKDNKLNQMNNIETLINKKCINSDIMMSNNPHILVESNKSIPRKATINCTEFSLKNDTNINLQPNKKVSNPDKKTNGNPRSKSTEKKQEVGIIDKKIEPIKPSAKSNTQLAFDQSLNQLPQKGLASPYSTISGSKSPIKILDKPKGIIEKKMEPANKSSKTDQIIKQQQSQKELVSSNSKITEFKSPNKLLENPNKLVNSSKLMDDKKFPSYAKKDSITTTGKHNAKDHLEEMKKLEKVVAKEGTKNNDKSTPPASILSPKNSYSGRLAEIPSPKKVGPTPLSKKLSENTSSPLKVLKNMQKKSEASRAKSPAPNMSSTTKITSERVNSGTLKKQERIEKSPIRNTTMLTNNQGNKIIGPKAFLSSTFGPSTTKRK